MIKKDYLINLILNAIDTFDIFDDRNKWTYDLEIKIFRAIKLKNKCIWSMLTFWKKYFCQNSKCGEN